MATNQRSPSHAAAPTSEGPASRSSEDDLQAVGDTYRVPVEPWPEFLEGFDGRWKPDPERGEHVTLIGQNQSGKTTLAKEILDLRTYPIVVATKPRDQVVSDFARKGYMVVRRLPLPHHTAANRIVYWPPAQRIEDFPKQREAIRQLFFHTFYIGGYTLYVDEAFQVSEMGLDPLTKLILGRGASGNLSMVTSTQRPSGIPMETYTEARHFFFWRGFDPIDTARIAGWGGQDRYRVARIVRHLPPHAFLYLYTPEARMILSRVDRPG